ncbi:MAG: hypothetical protein KF690_07885 [Bacteroidetes bacterium]|nr:hypothetical protein [Bacteroidota bacterium]
MRHYSHLLCMLALCLSLALAGCASCPAPKREYKKYRRDMRKQGWRMAQVPAESAQGLLAHNYQPYPAGRTFAAQE